MKSKKRLPFNELDEQSQARWHDWNNQVLYAAKFADISYLDDLFLKEPTFLPENKFFNNFVRGVMREPNKFIFDGKIDDRHYSKRLLKVISQLNITISKTDVIDITKKQGINFIFFGRKLIHINESRKLKFPLIKLKNIENAFNKHINNINTLHEIIEKTLHFNKTLCFDKVYEGFASLIDMTEKSKKQQVADNIQMYLAKNEFFITKLKSDLWFDSFGGFFKFIHFLNKNNLKLNDDFLSKVKDIINFNNERNPENYCNFILCIRNTLEYDSVKTLKEMKFNINQDFLKRIMDDFFYQTKNKTQQLVKQQRYGDLGFIESNILLLRAITEMVYKRFDFIKSGLKDENNSFKSKTEFVSDLFFNFYSMDKIDLIEGNIRESIEKVNSLPGYVKVDWFDEQVGKKFLIEQLNSYNDYLYKLKVDSVNHILSKNDLSNKESPKNKLKI